MILSVAPTEKDINTALRRFLIGAVPPEVEIVRGQDNRVAAPLSDNYIVITPLFRSRLATNVDAFVDAVFIGAISGSLLTVSSILRGSLAVGKPVLGEGVLDGTVITTLGSGVGGGGTYQVSLSQTVSSAKLAAGVRSTEQSTRMDIQIDIHGPNSSDNAQVISSLLRSPYGCASLAAINPAITPLYADDPRQMQFVDAEQQYEPRWLLTASLQVHVTVTIGPQEGADELKVIVAEISP